MNASTNASQDTGQVVRSSAIISVLNALGFASALLIDVIVAFRFGLGKDTDAFFVAFAVPQLIGTILMVSTRVSLVPVFTRVFLEEGQANLWRLTSNLVNLSLVGSVALAALGSLSAPWIILVLGAGLDDGTRQLASALSSLVFAMVVPLGPVEILKATLNSLQSFAVPAATLSVRNIITFIIVALLSPSLGIRALALAYVVAAWAQFVFVGAALMVRGFKYRLLLQWHEPGTVQALRQMRYPLAGAAIGQSNVLLERFFASFLSVGMVSALVYARRILRAVDSIFLTSISTVFLPHLSAQFTRHKRSEFRRLLILALKLALFLSVPVTVGTVVLSAPTVNLLFRRGAFDQDAVQATATLLSIYIIGVTPMAVLRILNAAYYAVGDTRTPFWALVASLVLTSVLDLVLFFVLGAAGLALALGLARAAITVSLFWLLHRKIGIWSSELGVFLKKVGLACAITGGVMFGLQRTVLENSGGLFGAAISLIIGIAVGAGVYGSLLLLLRVPEAQQVVRRVRRRFRSHRARTLYQ